MPFFFFILGCLKLEKSGEVVPSSSVGRGSNVSDQ